MSDERPHVRVEPGYRFGQPHIRGISADAIAGMVVAGESVETVMDEYGLSRAEVLIACWFMGEHGSKKWRKRWSGWARANYDRLSQHRYDEVDDPPGDGEAAEQTTPPAVVTPRSAVETAAAEGTAGGVPIDADREVWSS